MRITPSEAFVETLVANGVSHVFGVVGSAYMDALDIFEPAGIRFVPVAHEQGAAHMADGYARVTGRHGVCIAQNGPGVTNFVTAIAAAYWAHSPVVFITPEAGTASMGLGGFQETPQIPIFSEITKFQADVRRADRIAELTARAFDMAITERGPAQVNIPRDLFYGEIDTDIPRPRRLERSSGGPESLQAAADALASARAPVILAGGGLVMGDGVLECITLAERLSAPVCSTYLHNDAFPASHRLACGPLGYQGSKAAMKLLAEADVVLALGTRLGPFGTLPQYGIDYWPENAKIIQVDTDHRVLGLVKDIDIAVHGDAKLVAAEIDRRLARMNLASSDHADTRFKEIAAQKSAWADELNAWGQDGGSPTAPRRALRELENAMPEDAMVTTDIGNICSMANSYLRFERPNSFFAAMSFGNCGYAVPTALGCKLAAPDRPAIAYVGDGAWGLSFNEMLTAVRENIPVTVVLFNNGQWGAEKKNQIDFYDNRFAGTDLANPNWAEVAKVFGANGIRVDRPERIGDAFREAVACERFTVLELMMTEDLGDPFRRDALKKPVRLLEKYKAYSSA